MTTVKYHLLLIKTISQPQGKLDRYFKNGLLFEDLNFTHEKENKRKFLKAIFKNLRELGHTQLVKMVSLSKGV